MKATLTERLQVQFRASTPATPPAAAADAENNVDFRTQLASVLQTQERPAPANWERPAKAEKSQPDKPRGKSAEAHAEHRDAVAPQEHPYLPEQASSTAKAQVAENQQKPEKPPAAPPVDTPPVIVPPEVQATLPPAPDPALALAAAPAEAAPETASPDLPQPPMLMKAAKPDPKPVRQVVPTNTPTPDAAEAEPAKQSAAKPAVDFSPQAAAERPQPTPPLAETPHAESAPHPKMPAPQSAEVSASATETREIPIPAPLTPPTPPAPERAADPASRVATPLAVALPNAPGDHLASAGTAAPAQDPPRVASEHTFEQIVLGLQTKMDAANQRAEIELNPPHLGRLHVSIEVANGQLTANFQSSTDVVRDLLSSHLDRLKSVLEQQGIPVDKLAVTAPPQPDTSNQQGSGNLAHQHHDGRSGGAFSQDRSPGRQRHDDSFAQLYRNARREPPVDVLA